MDFWMVNMLLLLLQHIDQMLQTLLQSTVKNLTVIKVKETRQPQDKIRIESSAVFGITGSTRPGISQ